ncbi:MAG: RagB/SusD family nutrient uptake outer membrane protein [Gemmatimonadaceae bacterium]|nr:RagB/SusD family nutrient uptake outer membrane protein [Gemmatimonadaceae bacterium]
MNTHRPRARATRFVVATMAMTIAGGALTACDTLLEADAPSRILESTLLQPSNASVLVAGAIADVECALGNYVAAAGTISDEFMDAQANAAIWDLDRRTSNPATTLYATGGCGGLGGIYTPVSVARFQTDQALKLLNGWTDAQVPGRNALIARAAAYAGYAYVLLGEGFCSAAVDLGPEMTPAQVFAAAEARFTTAISTAGVPDSIRNMAYVGRARARLNQNKRTEAAADAALVPDNFTFSARTTAASGRAENRVFRVNNTTGQITVDTSFRGLTVNGTPDPRVPVVDAGRGGSLPTVRLWAQNKYGSLAASIPMATWREALLIRAEVAGGQQAVTLINQLRARHSLPQFQSNDNAAILAQVQEERRRELFLEGHRLFDTIRFNVPLRPPAGAAFPNGGGTYGSNKCLPLPDIERLNNPTISGG